MRPIETWLASGSLAAKIMGSLLCFMAVALPCMADTYWNVGVSGGRSGLDGFHLSIGEYYGVPEREVVVVHERGIYDEELPVVFYLARLARVHPGYIVDLRLSGMSWMDITLFLGLHPDIYYVPVVVPRYGFPFGHAYGYYHHHPRGGWTRHDLRDRDIINQVNLRFMTEHHRYAPEKIMRYRSEGRSFHDIDRLIRDGKDRTMTRKSEVNDYHHHYRDSLYRQPMTRQDGQVRYMTRSDGIRQDMTKPSQQTRTLTRPEQGGQYMARRDQPVRTVAGPDDWGKKTISQNRQTGDMTRQNRKTRAVTVPDEDKPSAAKQPKQLRHMTRREL